MKGRHVSKKSQRRLTKPICPYRDMSIPQLSKRADAGDEKAKRELRRLCGYAL